MLTSCALTRMVGAARSQPKFLRKLGPNFQNTGLEIEPRFPAKPLRRKSVPNLGRSWRESSLQPFGCKLVRLQLGQIQVASTAIHLHLLHGHRPRSRPDQIQNPNSKLGFWISDFGLGLGTIDTVWILHKIFASHADSGRRICTSYMHQTPPNLFVWRVPDCPFVVFPSPRQRELCLGKWGTWFQASCVPSKVFHTKSKVPGTKMTKTWITHLLLQVMCIRETRHRWMDVG